METSAVNVQNNTVCNVLWTSTCALHVQILLELAVVHVLLAQILNVSGVQ